MEPESSFSCLSLNEPSSIFSTICKIKDKVDPLDFIKQDRETTLHEYVLGLDNCRNKLYISAEIHPDSLNKGCDPSEYSCSVTKDEGVRGDCPSQYIGKKLGGDGLPRNVFPLNEKLVKWEAAEDLVYNHVKKGSNRHAKLLFGIETSEKFDNEFSRPSKIYYYFQLFENNEVVGDPIEGVFENTSPRVTHDYYFFNCGVKTYFNKSKNK